MNESKACLRCGGVRLQSGQLETGGFSRSTGFRPDNLKFLTMSSKAQVRTTICMDCGMIELAANPQDVKAIIKEPIE